MAGITIDIKDFTDEVISAMRTQVATGMEKIGIKAELYAKAKSPVDTGRLRNSLTHQTEDTSVVIGTDVEYGKYQEFGTSKMRAQPFLKPAVEEHLDEYKQTIKDALKS